MYEYMTFDEQLDKRKIRGRVLETLEFTKIRDKVIAEARTAYGKKLCEEMTPCCDENYVRDGLEWTREGMEHIMRFGALPLGGVRYIDDALVYAQAGGTLTCGQLLDFAAVLRSVRDIKAAASKARSAGSPFVDNTEPDIMGATDSLEDDDKLYQSIDTAIMGENEVSDRASKLLSDIRRERKTVANGIRSLLERVIAGNEDMLQEAIITIREGRYCVPVKADFKGRIDGIVHGASATGQTLFLEPMSVVEANNRISELTSQEEAEILRILGSLTASVLRSKDVFKRNVELCGTLDFCMAKASYGVRTRSVTAVLNNRGRVSYRKARHPLIPDDAVVPVDIEIGDQYSTLVITGPNTGGKTVSLKTCGLLTLMTLSGLGIPAEDGSEVCVFDRVLADIGDEQSIEQSLSTFSSHISNIVFILRNVRGKSLVLLDELGSGTDPTEGAALAIAIIEELRMRGCVILATTHYRELKSYAVDTPGVMNASCEFDTDTLAPTYKLIIGRPGSSNAFVISSKLGLPQKILDNAASHISSEEIAYETLIAKAEKDAKEASENLAGSNELKAQLELAKKALEDEKAALKASKNKILVESRAEQKAMLEEREDEINGLLRDMRRRAKQQSREETIEELNNIRRRLRAGINDISEPEDDEIARRVALSGEPVRSVIVGESYYVPSFDVTGVALTLPSKSGSVQISAGSMKYTVKLDELRMPTKTQHDEQARRRKQTAASSGKTAAVTRSRFEMVSNIQSELMLIGMTTAEAESRLGRYLEECSMSGINECRIVHGKGTGALRACVREVLSRNDSVDTYRDGIQGEGDSGVTIVRFKH